MTFYENNFKGKLEYLAEANKYLEDGPLPDDEDHYTPFEDEGMGGVSTSMTPETIKQDLDMGIDESLSVGVKTPGGLVVTFDGDLRKIDENTYAITHDTRSGKRIVNVKFTIAQVDRFDLTLWLK